MNPFDLSGKTILVTGASSGIGRAICVACGLAGARIVMVARNVERLAETRNMCAGDGHEIRVLDLEDLDAIPRCVRDVCKEVGPLSGLVHSAGLHQPCPLRAIRSKHLLAIFSVNSAAGVMLVKGLATKGNCGPNSSVVLISSVLGHAGQPGAIGYCMSKGALEAAVRAMALELADGGIRVNAIAPAVIETPMSVEFFKSLGAELSERIRAKHPCGLGQPSDVANTACFLLSDASRYITGVSLPVDGGYLAQ